MRDLDAEQHQRLGCSEYELQLSESGKYQNCCNHTHGLRVGLQCGEAVVAVSQTRLPFPAELPPGARALRIMQRDRVRKHLGKVVREVGKYLDKSRGFGGRDGGGQQKTPGANCRGSGARGGPGVFADMGGRREKSLMRDALIQKMVYA